MSPQVHYTNYPPSTVVKFGGRRLVLGRAVPLTVRLLTRRESAALWADKPQHGERVNLGAYHSDFSDTEVAYSFSSPRTHILVAGYAIHADPLVDVQVSSYNGSACVCAEDWTCGDGEEALELSDADALSEAMLRAVVLEGADTPIYAVEEPEWVETTKGPCVALRRTMRFLNDCEREVHVKEHFSVTAPIATASSPTSYPPLPRALAPVFDGGFWSYVWNRALEQRLTRDAMLEAHSTMNALRSRSRACRSRDPGGASAAAARDIERLATLLQLYAPS